MLRLEWARRILAALFADPPPRLVPTRRARPSDWLGIFGLRIAVFAIAAATFLPDVLATDPNKIAYYHDEHNALMQEEVARKTIVDFHQFPAWNPYFCGGIPKLANPPDTSLAPDFLLRLLFGTEPGRRLAAFFLVVLGMEGVFRLARRHDASVPGAATGAIAFATSYYFVTLLRDGWVFMYAYLLIPWAALCFEEGVREPKWRLLGGFFIAWMVLAGGTYVTMYAGLVLLALLVIETIRAARKTEGPDAARWWQPSLSLATMGAVAFGLTAVRVLPMLKIVLGIPRLVDQKDADSPLTVLSWVVMGHSDRQWSSTAGAFYVGTAVVVFALIGVAVADRAAGRFLGLALLFLGLAIGEVSQSAPYVFLHKLPLYSQLRFPFRMTILVCLFVALAGARGLTRIEDALAELVRRRSRGRAMPAIVPLSASLLGAALACALGYRAAKDVVSENQIPPGAIFNMDPAWRRPGPFRQARGNRWDAHVFPRADLGSLMCFEENGLPESPLLRGDLPAEEYPAPGTQAVVERVEWTPNRIVLRVVSDQGAHVFVNQNWSASWRASVGKVEAVDGLLTIRVPAGEHRVTLRYVDRRMVAGGVITSATLLLLGVYAARRGLRRSRELAAEWRALPWRGAP